MCCRAEDLAHYFNIQDLFNFKARVANSPAMEDRKRTSNIRQLAQYYLMTVPMSPNSQNSKITCHAKIINDADNPPMTDWTFFYGVFCSTAMLLAAAAARYIRRLCTYYTSRDVCWLHVVQSRKLRPGHPSSKEEARARTTPKNNLLHKKN